MVQNCRVPCPPTPELPSCQNGVKVCCIKLTLPCDCEAQVYTFYGTSYDKWPMVSGFPVEPTVPDDCDFTNKGAVFGKPIGFDIDGVQTAGTISRPAVRLTNTFLLRGGHWDQEHRSIIGGVYPDCDREFDPPFCNEAILAGARPELWIICDEDGKLWMEMGWRFRACNAVDEDANPDTCTEGNGIFCDPAAGGDTTGVWVPGVCNGEVYESGSVLMRQKRVHPTWYLQGEIDLGDGFKVEAIDCADVPPIPEECDYSSRDCFPDCISSVSASDCSTPTHSLLFIDVDGPAGCCLPNSDFNWNSGAGGYFIPFADTECYAGGPAYELKMYCDGSNVKLQIKLRSSDGTISDTTSTITLTCVGGEMSYSFSFSTSTFFASLDYCGTGTGTVTITITNF